MATSNYKCKLCRFTSKTEEGIRKHIFKIHKENLQAIDRKNKIYGGIIGVVLGSIILYTLIEVVGAIIGFIIFFIIFYSGEKYLNGKNKIAYYSAYYGIKYGWIIVIIGIILVALFTLGIFSPS